jgi:thioredoxin 1
MSIASVIHTNGQSIGRVLVAGLPVALIFWSKHQPLDATWEALLERSAAQYAGRLLIAKVDADTEQAVAQQYALPTLPAFVLVRQGKTEVALPARGDSNSFVAWVRHLLEGGPRPAMTSAPTANSDGKPITLTDANFNQIVQGEKPVLVDFWAPWCGPCRMVAPAVEELAKSFQGRAVIGKLNVDENPQTAQRYQIMSIPALYIFKGGKVVDRMVGAQPAAILQQRLAQHA